MQPAALRLPALQLLQLLLEDAALAQLFEGSLAQAAAIRGEPGPPTATAGTSGTGEGGGGSTPAQDAAPALSGSGGAGNGMAPMQADGGEAEGPWIGAAAIAERLLDSYVLDEALPGDGSPPRGSGAAAGSAAAVGAPGSSSSSSSGSSRDGTTVARAALQLVAALRESRQRGILVSLLLDDACGAPGCMLAQRLVQLAEAALAQPGEEAALMLLCPQQCPQGGGGSGGDGTMLLHRQAAWQARLRVAQEALTLLRGLLVDDSCGEGWLGGLAVRVFRGVHVAQQRFAAALASRPTAWPSPAYRRGGHGRFDDHPRGCPPDTDHPESAEPPRGAAAAGGRRRACAATTASGAVGTGHW